MPEKTSRCLRMFPDDRNEPRQRLRLVDTTMHPVVKGLVDYTRQLGDRGGTTSASVPADRPCKSGAERANPIMDNIREVRSVSKQGILGDMNEVDQTDSTRRLSRLQAAFKMSPTHRALVYAQHGNPLSVLRAKSVSASNAPTSLQVRLKLLLSPINPADLNVIEGVYPSRPPLRNDLVEAEEVYVGGSEGLGVVTEVGGRGGLKVGDRVILDKSQSGIWVNEIVVDEQDLMKVDEGLSDVAAATMRVSGRSFGRCTSLALTPYHRSIHQLR